MASALKLGQLLRGKLSTYRITETRHRENIWKAICSNTDATVIVKTNPDYRLDGERDALKRFRGLPSLRQLVDEIPDPPSLVLKYFDASLLDVARAKRLEGNDLKFVAKSILQVLNAFHEEGYVHTDVKPDNILVDYGDGRPGSRFSEVALADCEYVLRMETAEVDYTKKEEGRLIGAPIFRSPESMLQLRWGPSTDIWSFGATLISLMFGDWHMFLPPGADQEAEEYPMQVLMRQIIHFGPVPRSYMEITDDDQQLVLGSLQQHISDEKMYRPFARACDKEVTKEDRAFIVKIMKLDPRDRPTAKELLRDDWFASLRAEEDLGPAFSSPPSAPEQAVAA